MASNEEDEPAISSTKLRLPLSMLDELRLMKTGENVSLTCTKGQDQERTSIQATITSDNVLELDIGGTSGSNVVSEEHGVRRSRRQHRGKSALELLGISPKKVAKSNTSSSVKNVKKTPVKPDKLTDNAVIKKTENEKPIQSEKNAQQEKTSDYIRVDAKSDQNRSCDVTVSDETGAENEAVMEQDDHSHYTKIADHQHEEAGSVDVGAEKQPDTTNAVIKSSTGGQHQSQSIASPPDRSEVTRSEFTNHIQPDAHQRSDVTNQILPDTQPSSDVTNQNQPDTEQRSEITNQNQPDTEQRSEVTNQNQPNSQQSPEVTSSSIDGTNDVLIECSNLQNQELAVNRAESSLSVIPGVVSAPVVMDVVGVSADAGNHSLSVSDVYEVETQLGGTVLHIQEPDGSTGTIQVIQVLTQEEGRSYTDLDTAQLSLIDQDMATQDAVETLIKLEDPVVSEKMTSKPENPVLPKSTKTRPLRATRSKPHRDDGDEAVLTENEDNAGSKVKGSGTINRKSKTWRKARDEPMSVKLSDHLQQLFDAIKPTETLFDNYAVIKNKTGGRSGFLCNHCPDNTFVKTKAQAITHLAQHKDFKPWKCPLCDYAGVLSSHVRRHMNVHSEEKAYVCQLCGRGFNFRQKLNIHMKYHRNERDHHCPYCELSFHEYKTLKNHLQRIHPTTDQADGVEGNTNDSIFSHGRKGRSGIIGTRKTLKLMNMYQKSLAEQKSQKDQDDPTAVSESPNNGTVTIATDDPVSTSNGRDAEKSQKRKSRIKTSTSIWQELAKFITEKKTSEGTVSRTTYQCKVCQQEFPIKSKVINHLECQHRDLKIWKCPNCPYRSRVRSNLNVHIKLHTGIKDHICKICGKGFAFKQKLQGHMKFHLNLREYKCDICERAFNHKNDLTKHRQRVHTTDRPEKCSVCGKTYKDKLMLRRHMASHGEDNKQLCEICNKYYMNKQSLQQHMKSHSCMFHCEICDKSFGSYSGFMAHKVMHDESYSGYVCQQCNKVLHTKGSLQRHIKVFHNTERPHKCETCEKTFKTAKDLKNHQIVHEMHKPFQCTSCDYSSKRLESLRVHMRRHSDAKPFKCGICFKQYTQKHALESHLRFHEGQAGGQCQQCEKSFTNKYQLQVHMEKKHSADVAVPVAPSTVQTSQQQAVVNTGGASEAFTVFMCEECNSVFLTQDNLAVHILAEHIKHGYIDYHHDNNTGSGSSSVESGSQVALSTSSTGLGVEDNVTDSNHHVTEVTDIMAEESITTSLPGDIVGMETGVIEGSGGVETMALMSEEQTVSLVDGQTYVSVAQTVEIPDDQQDIVDMQAAQDDLDI